MNSIKLKLIIIYAAVVLIIMIASGTFMVYELRRNEIEHTFSRLEGLAEVLETHVVRVYGEPQGILGATHWEMLDAYDIQGMILNDIGRPIAPWEFVELFSNQSLTDGAILSAVGGNAGFDVRSRAIDVTHVMQRWLSHAMPVTIHDSATGESTTFIVYTRVSAVPLNDRVSGMILSLVITILISVVLTAVLWFFLANRITNPIVTMIDRAKAMAQGELSAEIPVHGKDEIGQLAYNFNHMARELSQLDTMRKEFVANVSHELRTPLTSIRTYTETLLEGALDEPETATRFLKIVDDEAQRMSLLVTDLLELSRLDSARTKLDQDVLDLVGLLRVTIRQSQILAEQKNQTIEFDPPEESCFILANAPRFNQVVFNVLSNSVKYSPDDTTITVSVEITDNDYRVFIKDQGVGIPEDSVNRIFERFYRVDKGRSRAMGGTGLGLAIAKEIIEEMGGNIYAFSPPGEGTTMVVRVDKYVEC
ncbi:MAG: cell wall metabolism sensor histidine kinase WalK [Defluviitaleaceae bacterium]|nr:cell wall metabolism sensor histidine kinase WalK [Defluviitaleaceae bacterium]